MVNQVSDPSAPPQPPPVPSPDPQVLPVNGADPAVAPEPAVAGDQPDGGEPEPTQPAWATLGTPDEVLGHEEIAPIIQEREEAALGRGRKESHEAMQPILRRTEEHYRLLSEKLGQFGQSLTRMQRDGQVTPEAISDLLTDHAKDFETMRGADKFTGFRDGAGFVTYQLAQAAKNGEIIPTFEGRILERLTADQQYGETDPKLWGDLVGAFTKGAKAPLEAELKEAKAEVTRLKAEATQAQRTAQPAPARVDGAGGGTDTRSDRELKADPNTPVAKLMEIRSRERAG